MQHERALTRALAGTGATYDFSGTWKNELGSGMVLSQAGNTLSGTYQSAVSGGGGSTTGDLIGYVDGDLVSVIVHWRDFQAITAWVGQLVPNASPAQILTLWQMTQQVAVGEEWKSINAGTDTFTQV